MRRPHIIAILLVTLILAGAALSSRQTAGPSPEGARRVVAAAEGFLAMLAAEQRKKASLDLNEKTRTVWSNLPSGVVMQVGATERNGIKLGDMTPPQEKAALALVAGVLSRDGFAKAMAIVDADQVLEERSAPTRKPDSRTRFGRAEYYVAILGTPSATEPWMIQFGGHHLAINVTIAGAAHVLAPTHTGAQPAAFSVEGRMVRPLGDENDKAFALINALNDDQRRRAVLGVEVRNLVLGPGADGKMIAPEGVRADTLTAEQRRMLLDLTREWVEIVGEQAAAARMKAIEAGMAETYFAWAGETTNGKGAYFRIHGPAVFIEYAPQGQGAANIDHIHTIYRDPTNDYGARAARR